jgi:hypothetical protein
MDKSSGVGVLDKAAIVLGALEAGPATLAQLVAATGLARPTAHRLAVALEHHRLVARDLQGRFVLGPRLAELATAAGEDRLLATAGPVLTALRDHTGESAQLYRRQGDQRICVAAAERPMGLRDSIPVGSALTMRPVRRAGPARLGGAGPAAPRAAGRAVHRDDACRRCAAAAGRRASGSASRGGIGVGAGARAVRQGGRGGVDLGPVERFTRQPGRVHAAAVVSAARALTDVLRRAQADSPPAPGTTTSRQPPRPDHPPPPSPFSLIMQSALTVLVQIKRIA